MGSNCEKKRHKAEENEEEDRAMNVMETLPTEITIDILSRLPISSLVQFKYACGPWRALVTHDRRFAEIHLSRAVEVDPCLIFHSDSPIQNQLYFSDVDAHKGFQQRVRKFKTFPFMPEFDVVGSCNGFLCLSNSLFGNQLCIYNPFTGNYIGLPQTSFSCSYRFVYGFGFHPRTKEYKVVKVIHQKLEFDRYPRARTLAYEEPVVHVFTIGTHVWRDLGRIPHLHDGRESQALVNGSLHWLTQPMNPRRARHRLIVSFDLGSEQFQKMSLPQCGNLKRCNHYLVAIQDCLSAVVYGGNGDLDIWVMKDYNVVESWTKEYTIKAYVPIGLRGQNDLPVRGGIDRINKFNFRILGMLKNREILLEFKSRVLVSYHPDCEEFKDLTFHGLPKRFHTVLHVGSVLSAYESRSI